MKKSRAMKLPAIFLAIAFGVFLISPALPSLSVTVARAAATPSLSLQSGTAAAGGSVALNVSFDAASANIAGIQWDFTYNPADISAVSVTDGVAATATSKSASCNLAAAGDYRCVVYGTNLTSIGSGVLAVATFTLSNPTSAASVPVSFSGVLGSDANANAVTMLSTNGTITVTTPGGGSSSTPPPPATSPPPATTPSSATGNIVISNVNVDISKTPTGIISWTTDVVGVGYVQFGFDTNYVSNSQMALPQGTDHFVSLVGLTSGTTYHYRIIATDSNGGNRTVSSDGSFTTPSPASSAPAKASSTPASAASPTTTPPSAPVVPTPPSPSPAMPAAGPSLVNDHGTFYFVQNGQRQGITNPGMLESYGFTFKQAKAATPAILALPPGPLLSPNDGALVKSKQDPTVYLISNKKRYSFVSAKVFLGLGFKFASILIVTNPELQALPKADKLTKPTAAHLPGLDINKKGGVYWVGTDNQLHPYPSLAVYNSWHVANDFRKVVPANSADNLLPVGSPVTMRAVE